MAHGAPSGEWSGRDLSGEAPPSLAELPALAEPEGRRGSDPVHQGVTASDGLTKTEPDAVGCREMPTVLRLEGVGDALELGLLAHFRGRTLDHEVQIIVESVASSREHAVRVLREVLGLAFGWTGAEVQRAVQPDPEQWGDVGAPIRTHRRQPVHLGALEVCERRGPLRRDRTIAAERAQVGCRLPLNHLASEPPSLTQQLSRRGPRRQHSVAPMMSRVLVTGEPSCAANSHPGGSNADDGLAGHGHPGNPHRLPTSIPTSGTRSWRPNIACR